MNELVLLLQEFHRDKLTALLRQEAQPPVAVTTIPLVADLIGDLPVRRWVYYCVDDFSVWPGLDSRPLRQMEADLVRKADQVIAVSETLRDKLRRILGFDHAAPRSTAEYYEGRRRKQQRP